MNRVMKFTAAVSALAIGAGFAGSAAAQDFAITNATVAIGDGSEPVNGATVVVRGGKIVAAGAGVAAPGDLQVYDGQGSWVTPGIFMPLTDLGLWDVGAVNDSNDVRAGDARFGAALDASTAVNYASQHIAVSRAGGVTRATITTAPADSIFAGQGAAIDLGADPDAVMQAKKFQLVVLGEMGARIAGGSRIAAYAEFANALREARDLANGNWSGEDNLLTRADAAALGAVISGQQQLYVHVERAADITAVLGLKRTYPKLDLVLVGVSEGWIVARQIAASGVPVIADPLDDLPSSFEQLGATQSNVGRMVDAGVKVALGGLSGGITGPRTAPQFAGNLVALQKVPRASGLTWGEAFASITSIPAEISGYGGQFGVLKPGAAGDVVVWDGDPLEVSSAPVRVFIDGIEQPLTSHQTRLRDRYRDLDESDLPKAYDW
ncbi:amidohydrolase family protein [Pontixanthobacter luteolus]|uniref:amidohydrolase family protein n=1 Tax=Pontixanthobacter luteolus TaxID=295089 RepID=UPI002302CE10|nr:amidohydrolase family protein [Pontixanthobacter luteolus]